MSFGALVLAAVLSADAHAAHPHRVEVMLSPLAKGKGVEVMSEEALARFDDKSDASARRTALQNAGFSVQSPVGKGPWQLVYMPSGMTVAAGLSVLKAMPGVLAAEPNHAYRALKTPNDPLVGSQWHLGNVGAFAAWQYETGATHQVDIAVIDTGIQMDHPDLLANLDSSASRDCSGGTCTTNQAPACDHATRVAGVAAAAANNGTGVAGMSWSAKLVSLRVFPDGVCTSDCGDVTANSCTTSDAAISAALAYAQSLPAPVIANMSIGATGSCPSAIQTAIDLAFAAGVTVFAAAGNDGGSVNNPGNCNHVVPVGATDSNNSVAAFSCRGAELAANGLVAPGVNLVTTDINSGYTSAGNGATGTSFSSPLAAGIAALMLSAKPTLTPAQVQANLRASASNIGVSAAGLKPGVSPLGNVAGAGMLNAYSAMRLTMTGSTQFDGTAKAIAFPNPFHPASDGTVTLTVPVDLQGGHTTIKIYSQSAQLVRDLGGSKSWDGKNDAGLPVATGTYLFLIKSDKGSTTSRLALIR
ncbi:MAG: S8 family serine peptidase [Elusimicrobia bacterium]|nr:S8 family serine peptidase [Elusimicrobiota bacterium]